MKKNLKRKLKNVTFLLVMLKMCIVFSQNHATKKRIIIDVGHGGFDTGAIGVNGLQEKDVVLNIAKEIVKLNKTILDNTFEIYLTRYRDTFVSLSDRGKVSKILKTDLFVSLHCNASKRVSRGMEVYVSNSKRDAVLSHIQKSMAMAEAIHNETTQKLYIAKRGVKFANFQVLRETIAFCPSVLVETGFVTNADEANYFLNPKNIRAMAMAILMGVYNYLNIAL